MFRLKGSKGARCVGARPQKGSQRPLQLGGNEPSLAVAEKIPSVLPIEQLTHKTHTQVWAALHREGLKHMMLRYTTEDVTNWYHHLKITAVLEFQALWHPILQTTLRVGSIVVNNISL